VKEHLVTKMSQIHTVAYQQWPRQDLVLKSETSLSTNQASINWRSNKKKQETSYDRI